jgi:hypothetical protein
VALILAVVGGIASLLNVTQREEITKYIIITKIVSSGFIGLMFLKFCRWQNFESDMVGVICGMAGWIGPAAIDRLASKIGINVRGNP